jgi:hypothetical protein
MVSHDLDAIKVVIVSRRTEFGGPIWKGIGCPDAGASVTISEVDSLIWM